jgi:hypothetical protein
MRIEIGNRMSDLGVGFDYAFLRAGKTKTA